jgi:hypothetical protein
LFEAMTGTAVLFMTPHGFMKLDLEDPVKTTQQSVTFRAELWKEFVAGYQIVLATAPETFSNYCAKFRERWIAGK